MVHFRCVGCGAKVYLDDEIRRGLCNVCEAERKTLPYHTAGCEAFREGIKMLACPFLRLSQAWHHWRNGWLVAMSSHRDQLREEE